LGKRLEEYQWKLPTIFSPLKITPEKIAITAPKEEESLKETRVVRIGK